MLRYVIEQFRTTNIGLNDIKKRLFFFLKGINNDAIAVSAYGCQTNVIQIAWVSHIEEFERQGDWHPIYIEEVYEAIVERGITDRKKRYVVLYLDRETVIKGQAYDPIEVLMKILEKFEIVKVTKLGKSNELNNGQWQSVWNTTYKQAETYDYRKEQTEKKNESMGGQ